MCVCVCVCVCLTSVTPWTVVHQVPLSMGFSRQKYWSGLLFPSLEDLPNSGIKSRSPALQVDSLLSEPLGMPISDDLPPIFSKLHCECRCKLENGRFKGREVVDDPETEKQTKKQHNYLWLVLKAIAKGIAFFLFSYWFLQGGGKVQKTSPQDMTKSFVAAKGLLLFCSNSLIPKTNGFFKKIPLMSAGRKFLPLTLWSFPNIRKLTCFRVLLFLAFCLLIFQHEQNH